MEESDNLENIDPENSEDLNNALNDDDDVTSESEDISPGAGAGSGGEGGDNVIQLSGLYKDWFLDYASYVILERAVPALYDGLKPVQRRILHSLKEMDDGRYNKVANVIGNTMKYHPHGDASIGDALVQLGQKDILIDCQGNWGNTLTGDRAAAARYIEARLSKFAGEVVFNPKTTNWQASYDGRNKEPVHLPVKFPLLLAQGAEGIAVGLACKMLPHNFVELIDASIDILRNRKPTILPDFLNGGMADFTNYNDGLRGGKVRVRARLEKVDKKTLVVNEIPYGTTTTSLIESVLRANDKGKIKIKKIEDNTAQNAEIMIHLPPGVSPDKMIDALYAFTDCEVSISPNSCVIHEERPVFMGVTDILRFNTQNTVNLLKLELEIKRSELQSKWHFASLEKIFIEKRIYRDIEEEETWEGVVAAIDKGLHQYISTPSRVNKKKDILQLLRDVTEEDIVRLTEIKIKRISKFDTTKHDDYIKSLEEQLEEVQEHLDNLIDYAVAYFRNLKEKYGEGRERKTEIKAFDTIQARKVIVNNRKLYVDREEGFIGYALRKKELEPIMECSEIDDVIVFFADGKMTVTKIADKKFVGKGIIEARIWKKNDTRTIYHLVYQDGSGGATMMKRFAVKSITRDKEYDLTKGQKGSKVHYFSVNPNGEREILSVQLRRRPHLRKLRFEVDFGELAIKGRGAAGNRMTKELVSKVEFKESGGSTLAARKIWFDDVVGRLNDEGRGRLLGAFRGDDKIIALYSDGYYKLTHFDLAQRFDDGMVILEKWDPEKAVSAVYFDGKREMYYVKRFLAESPFDKKVYFIGDDENSRLATVQYLTNPRIKIIYSKRYRETKNLPDKELILADFIEIKGLKAQGNQLTKLSVKDIEALPPLEGEEPNIEAQIEAQRAAQAATQAEQDKAEAEAAKGDEAETPEGAKDDAPEAKDDADPEAAKVEAAPKAAKKAPAKATTAIAPEPEGPVTVEWDMKPTTPPDEENAIPEDQKDGNPIREVDDDEGQLGLF